MPFPVSRSYSDFPNASHNGSAAADLEGDSLAEYGASGHLGYGFKSQVGRNKAIAIVSKGSEAGRTSEPLSFHYVCPADSLIDELVVVGLAGRNHPSPVVPVGRAVFDRKSGNVAAAVAESLPLKRVTPTLEVKPVEALAGRVQCACRV